MRLALAGDTMLGRGVAERLLTDPAEALFAPEIPSIAAEADIFVLNLECCISRRGEPWNDPGKPFFFRAPPAAIDVLSLLGVDCVTLANNHALDFGVDALVDTLDQLDRAGIAHVGAGATLADARAPVALEAAGETVTVVGVTDHPADFAAAEHRTGVALADLRAGVPRWLETTVAGATTNAVLVTPHWGPNMIPEPLDYVRAAARALVRAGATLVAGHSAHVFHGVAPPVLYDLGDFIDDYAVDDSLRNDLGLLWLITLDSGRPKAIEAIPLRLDYCFTRVADGADAEWIEKRLRSACAALGTTARTSDGRLIIEVPARESDEIGGRHGQEG